MKKKRKEFSLSHPPPLVREHVAEMVQNNPFHASFYSFKKKINQIKGNRDLCCLGDQN